MSQPNRIEPLPDGIYLGLSSDDYHADSALGSTNIRHLLRGSHEYWHRSPLNPNQKKVIEDDSTQATVYGTAMHVALLEGFDKFKATYVRRPDDDEDATSGQKSAATKAAKAALKPGKILLHGDEYDQVLDSMAIIDRDADLTGSLVGGLSEVSVFWTRKDGTRLKCRFDKLKLNAYCDVKTIANEKGRELGQACGDAIIYRGYEIQIEHYNEGRRALPGLVDRINFVGGVTPAEKQRATDFLHAIASEQEFNPTILFLPKPTSGAPDPLLFVFDVRSPDLRTAREHIETALMVYRDALKKYGEDQRWQPNRPVVRQWDRTEAAYGASRWAA